MLRTSLVWLFAALSLPAQSQLTTTFANNNSGSVGGAVYFDLAVTTSEVTISGLELNLTGTGSIEVYVTLGSRIGMQTNSGAWTLVSTGAVTGAVAGAATKVDIPTFHLDAGSYGIALKTIGVSHNYTNGTGSNQIYSNADLTLSAGDATNVAFTAPVITPRVVNARFTYFVGGQVAIPPHATVYNGLSRGFNFTSNTDFNITQLSLPLDANVAGDTASYLVMINGAVAYRSIGNAGAVNPGIHVSAGDIVDVIGNWSPAAAGSFSAHNSYAAGAPYQTFIAGIANTLNRTGWQWDIGDPNWTPNGSTGAYLSPTIGSMGRIFMTGVVGTTMATATELGNGCISRHGSVYENFQTSASFDLTGHAITLFPVVGGGYTVSSLGTFRPVGSTSAPVVLALGDDSQVTVPFTLGSFPGWTGVTVCSNGFISKDTGNGTGFTPSVGIMLAASQDAFWSWHDFNPSAGGGGQVKIEQATGLTVITWDGVWDFGGTSASNANTLQFQLYASGVASIVWGTMSGLGNGHVVGFSPGGPSPNPGSSDLSALGSNTISLLGTEVLPLTLTANRPVAGTNWQLYVTNVPATGVLGVDILGLSDPGFNDLTIIGMPTCGMRASLDVLNLWFVAGPTHSSTWPVPNNLSLLNIHLFATTAVLQTPPINAFGAITSNGIDGKIGDS